MSNDTNYKLMEDNTYGEKNRKKLSTVNNVEITNEKKVHLK